MGFALSLAQVNFSFGLNNPLTINQGHCKPAAEVVDGRKLHHLAWTPDKVAEGEPCIDLGDGQDEAEHTDGPPMSHPSFFN